MDLETRLVTTEREFENLREDWDRLWRSDANRTVFGSSAWARASWKSYGAQRDLCIPVVKEGSRVVAILPLCISAKRLAFLASPRSDYNDILCYPDVEHYAIGAAFRALKKAPYLWNRCELENLSANSKIVRWAESATNDLKRRMHLRFRCVCPCVTGCSRDPEILFSILKKKSLKRHENRLRRQGKLEFRHITDRPEIDQLLCVFFEQHIARRALAGDQSLFLDDKERAFCRHLVDQLDPEHELRFAVLEFEGNPIAFHFGFRCDEKMIWYKPSFDVDRWQDSPGEVLLRSLFQYVRAEGLDEFDFTTGDEAFKLRFANEIRENFTLCVFRGFPGHVIRVAYQVKEYLKQFPSFWRWIQQVAGESSRSLWTTRRWLRERGIKHVFAATARIAIRRCVYACDEVWVYTADQVVAECNNELDLREGRLSNLAIVSSQHPNELNSAKLNRARTRLREGSKLYETRCDGEIVHIAWSRISDKITDAGNLGSLCQIKLDTPGLIIFDCWALPNAGSEGIHRWTLRSLVRTARKDGMDSWTCCHREDVQSHRGIESAGFRLTHRMRKERWFGMLTRSRVLPQ